MKTSNYIRMWAALLLPLTLGAQGRHMGNLKPLHVRVRVTTATFTADTTVLGYTIDNTRVGGEDLWGFLLATPAQVVRMPRQASQKWTSNARYLKRPIAIWMFTGGMLPKPGQSSPELLLVARGIPDTAHYWAVPDLDTSPPIITDEEEDQYLAFSDSGVTVGVVPVPAGSTPSSLTDRLNALVVFTCGHAAWIPNRGTCTSLSSSLASAQQAFRHRDTKAARGGVRAFARQLDAAYCTPSGGDDMHEQGGAKSDDDHDGLDPKPCTRATGRDSDGDDRSANASTRMAFKTYVLLRLNAQYMLSRF